jgi:hypothetical protein
MSVHSDGHCVTSDLRPYAVSKMVGALRFGSLHWSLIFGETAGLRAIVQNPHHLWRVPLVDARLEEKWPLVCEVHQTDSHLPFVQPDRTEHMHMQNSAEHRHPRHQKPKLPATP